MKRVTNIRNNKTIVSELEMASSLKSRIVGLMGRPTLKAGQGLWIKRSGNSIHTFFMKFAIDVAFINNKGVVKHTAQNIKPWRLVFAPLLLPTDCLELPAGTLQSTDTKRGDTLRVET